MPRWSPLGVKFKISDEHPHLFHMRVPPPPPPGLHHPCCFMVYYYLFDVCFSILIYKVLFSGFLQSNSNFVDGQNNSKYRDWAPSNFGIQSKFQILLFISKLYFSTWSAVSCLSEARGGIQNCRFDCTMYHEYLLYPDLLNSPLGSFQESDNKIWTHSCLSFTITPEYFVTSPWPSHPPSLPLPESLWYWKQK